MLPHVVLTAADFAGLQERHTIAVDDAVFRFDGKGAIECLQGLLTNDVVRPGPGSAVWGAFLTPKGMIVTDAWVLRDDRGAWVLTPARAREVAASLFQRTVPPRLATVADATANTPVRWVLGPPPPAAISGAVFTPTHPAPMSAIVVAAADTDHELRAAGWAPAAPNRADAVRFVMGWPTLGREIDDRTLPQEVRFDELGGVRYDKGCYTGQETVARIHFRGHTNRQLIGLRWPIGDGPDTADVGDGVKPLGTIRTLARIADRYLALAVLRREVAAGDSVRCGATTATVEALPFHLADPAVA